MTLEAAPETGLFELNEPTRKGRIEAYMWDNADESSAYFAQDFYDPERPMAETAVLIPVAAHQDAAWIMPAMSEYAGQKDAEPFTIFLFLNYPEDSPADTAYEAIAQVEAAKRRYPGLDIRYTTNSYNDPTIGQIRKDLWDGALHVALSDGLYDKPGGEVIGINHDIDTERISPHYIRNVQSHYRMLQAIREATGRTESPLPSRVTQVKHVSPYETHPNIAKAIFWSDLTFRQILRNGVYTDGLVVPFSHYAEKGGWDENVIFGEDVPLIPENGAGIPRTGMETSPRRPILRIGHDNQAEIWTNDSFKSTDQCRDPEALPADISHAELEERIFDSLEEDLDKFCRGVLPAQRLSRTLSQLVRQARRDGGYDHQVLVNEARQTIDSRLRLARFALERVVESPLLASLLDDTVRDRYVEQSVNEMSQVLDEVVAVR